MHRTLSWLTIIGVTAFMEMIVNLVVRSFIVMRVNFVVLESERAREKDTVSER